MKKSFAISLLAFIFFGEHSFGQKQVSPVKNQPTVTRSNTVLVEGVQVPPEQAAALFGNRGNALIYIANGCCCVKPPCTCGGAGEGIPPFIFGLHSNDIVSMAKSSKKTPTGQSVTAFYVRRGAKIQTPVMAMVDQKTMAKATPKNRQSPSSQAGPMAKGVGVTVADIIDWFKGGWAIGTAIDEVFGLSDALSDWMLEFWGPWRPPAK